MINRVSIGHLVLVAIAIGFWCVSAVHAQQFVIDGLIGFWTLDKSDIDGSEMKDVLGETNGKIEGDPESADGIINQGMEFDGIEDRIEIPKELMVGLESFTIECWFNYDNSSNWRWMFGGGPEWNYGLGYCIYSGGNIVRYHLKTDEGSFYDGNGTTTLTPGQWYHIAYTYDGKNARSYVDTELDFERAITGSVLIDPSTLAIGAGYMQNSEYFVGMIDEVRVYNRALSEEEIEKNFNATSNSMAVDAVGKLIETWGKVKGLR